ncbi:hypothetical protein [Halpernia sp.]|uniref:hypothetical protein n=1 Tax=Halpernia sp. TaxID=2782209 RepID=UPI003A905376
MKTLIQILIFFISLNFFGQTENINSGKYHPAKEIFETKYKKMTFGKFLPSQIIVTDNKVSFNITKSFEFSEKSNQLTKLILTSGLLDPYEINGSYQLTISIIDELYLLNPNPQTRRFKFWIYNSNSKNSFLNSVNPSEYYFELQNENADENTTLADFIKGAQLTFLTFGTIVI